MTDVTQILSDIEHGDPAAAERLLPLVYDELRKLAAAKLSNEKPGQTLQATALVHETYIRLVDVKACQQWNSRHHFFAAAESMRRILVERARKKQQRVRHGGAEQRVDLDVAVVADENRSAELLAVHEALAELEQHDAQAATLVKLRYFAGLSHSDAAEALGVSRRVADRLWVAARTWLHQKLSEV
jgi:RNA polymerase sigma factor (TIGR02999 family)